MDDNSDDDGTGDDVLADDDRNDDDGGDENDDDGGDGNDDDGGDGNDDDGPMIHVDLHRFKEFLRNNKDGIIYCMRKTRLPHTNNPFASFQNTQRFVRLMRHEDALQVVLESMLQDEDIKRLQKNAVCNFKMLGLKRHFLIF